MFDSQIPFPFLLSSILLRRMRWVRPLEPLILGDRNGSSLVSPSMQNFGCIRVGVGFGRSEFLGRVSVDQIKTGNRVRVYEVAKRDKGRAAIFDLMHTSSSKCMANTRDL